MKPIWGCIELDCEDRSDLRDLRLGEGEIMADGLSLGACGYVLTDFCEDLCLSSGLETESVGVLLSRKANGFSKDANAAEFVGPKVSSSISTGECGVK